MAETGDKWASVGDVIEAEFEFPYRRKHRELLITPEAVALGNKLIASGRWKKLSREQRKEMSDGNSNH